jgi:hypothetical protein
LSPNFEVFLPSPSGPAKKSIKLLSLVSRFKFNNKRGQQFNDVLITEGGDSQTIGSTVEIVSSGVIEVRDGEAVDDGRGSINFYAASWTVSGISTARPKTFPSLSRLIASFASDKRNFSI